MESVRSQASGVEHHESGDSPLSEHSSPFTPHPSRSALPSTLTLLPPLGYLDFLALQLGATMIITDSGGIQEETTYLGIPCLTLRENTERPITVNMGTNILVGHDMNLLRSEVERILAGEGKKGSIPPLWDGHAGERIAAVIAQQSEEIRVRR